MTDRNKRSAHRVFRNYTDATLFSFLSGINTPRSLAVWLLYSTGEHDQLVELATDPSDYASVDCFRDDYVATSLLSKANFLRTSFNRREKALEKFRKSEEQCRTTNLRVLPFAPEGMLPPELLHTLIPRVQSKIRQVLGRFEVEELFDSSDWGPGVSTFLKGSFSVKPNKYQSEIGMTQEVHDVIWPLLQRAYPSWHAEILAKASPRVEAGNVITTVPKNSKTDRVIAIEPGWNLWFQKGVGAMIRSRLLRVGCNLNDQGNNQELSRLAYHKGLATVDFSSASDTIAKEVVRLLLPPEWYRILDLFRCKTGRLSPDSLYWEKFSSMGNGFTFELESLIFWAIAFVVTEEAGGDLNYVSVFGDDVILPSACFDRFSELSVLLGFTVNTGKSFSSGNFYESCGAHWFRGVDVKPFYLESPVDSLAACYGLHNNIMLLAHRSSNSFGLDRRFKKTCALIRSLVPPCDFLLVPRQFGDAGFVSNLDHALTLKTTKVTRMVGYKIRISTEVAVKVYFDGWGLILDRIRHSTPEGEEHAYHVVKHIRTPARLSSFARQLAKVKMPLDPGSNMVPLKSRTKRTQCNTTVGFGQWYDFGPWI